MFQQNSVILKFSVPKSWWSHFFRYSLDLKIVYTISGTGNPNLQSKPSYDFRFPRKPEVLLYWKLMLISLFYSLFLDFIHLYTTWGLGKSESALRIIIWLPVQPYKGRIPNTTGIALLRYVNTWFGKFPFVIEQEVILKFGLHIRIFRTQFTVLNFVI